MNKYLLLFPAILLIGAGCAPQTQVKTQAQVSTQPPALEKTTESNEAGITFENIEEKNGETKTTDEVPVVDIVLGGEVDQTISMEAGNFSFSPNTINAKPGDKIKITFTKNIGFHTFVIDEIEVKHAIKQGESLIFTAPSTPGSYAFYCDVGSHKTNGMEGVLIVK